MRSGLFRGAHPSPDFSPVSRPASRAASAVSGGVPEQPAHQADRPIVDTFAGLILFAEWPNLQVRVGTGIVFASIFGLTRSRSRSLFRHRMGVSSG